MPNPLAAGDGPKAVAMGPGRPMGRSNVLLRRFGINFGCQNAPEKASK